MKCSINRGSKKARELRGKDHGVPTRRTRFLWIQKLWTLIKFVTKSRQVTTVSNCCKTSIFPVIPGPTSSPTARAGLPRRKRPPTRRRRRKPPGRCELVGEPTFPEIFKAVDKNYIFLQIRRNLENTASDSSSKCGSKNPTCDRKKRRRSHLFLCYKNQSNR